MKLFADTANLDEIKELVKMGVISGVTTNPSIISKEPKQNYDKLIADLAKFCGDNWLPFSVEVFTTDPTKMYQEAQELHSKLAAFMPTEFLNIKIPVGVEELKVIRLLSARNNRINVNCTACFTEMQLQAACLADANYVSLFYNRAKDTGVDVNRALARTKAFIKTNFPDDAAPVAPPQIIAGSIRTPQDVSDAWAAGADVVTCSPKIIKQMLEHPGTAVSIQGFEKDFSAWIGK